MIGIIFTACVILTPIDMPGEKPVCYPQWINSRISYVECLAGLYRGPVYDWTSKNPLYYHDGKSVVCLPTTTHKW